ncbi:helix-turn-helix domain-containing protein [Marinobacter sp. TBZ242]|uniref:Helix-turn-helix domain-containing protein n=1 Tax=Marinobacter azerbaijanicus TaxID=3050455 RepID=A0ABT7IIS8_9GAMM|nr:helix-turn-helix domain-containing protein [Marinobacter sp. TBZ242]MDL0434086.1 helix-turn-helix domain-containing protein [Marinobacter sp. TBZ242]
MPPTGLCLRQFAPGLALRDHVQCFWHAKGIAVPGAEAVELLHPDGGMGLLFNFGGALSRDGKAVAGACWVDGPKLRTARLSVGEELDLLGVRFLPGSGALFIGEALSALTGGELVPGDALRHLALETLHERLCQAPDLVGRIVLLEHFLLERLRHAEVAPPVLSASLKWLRRRTLHGPGAGSIGALVDALPIGQRRLERLFQQHVGLSPKRYARLLRIARSRELIKRGGAAVSLTDTAHAAGYFDQAHFIHDFKAVIGLTPGGYLEYVRQRYG